MDQEQKLNMDEKYIYYRPSEDEEDSYVRNHVRSVRKKDDSNEWTSVESKIAQTVKGEIEFTYSDVENFSLEKYGSPIPARHGNYTGLDNYFLDYWGHFLGPGATQAYIHLLRYSYGRTAYEVPIELICAKMHCKRDTLNSYFKTLEKYGFIYRFWRRKRDDNNKPATIHFKIKRNIPFLSESLLEELKTKSNKGKGAYNKLLYQQHQKDVKEFMKSADVVLNSKDDYDSIYENIMDKGFKRINKVDAEREAMAKDLEELFDLRMLQLKLTNEDRNIWEQVKAYLETRISKPQFETYFAKSACKLTSSYMIVYVKFEFYTPNTLEKMQQIIKEALREFGHEEREIIIQHVLMPSDMKQG